MKERLKNILNADDIDGLIKFWRSPECQARSERGKANRAHLKVHHTSGTISHACHSYNMSKKLGRPARRDEVYVSTHTSKNGVPLREAATTIDALKAIVEAQPDLKDKTIQEGDAFAAVCGAKEPRGRVRVLGLGPTPQEVGTPGLKALMSTKMQMEIWGRQEAERKNIAYQQRIAELEEMARERANVEVLSQHGSNSRQYATPTPEGPTDEAHNAAQLEQYAENEDYDQYEEDENLLPNRHAIVRTTATNVRPSFPNDTHAEMQESLPPSGPVVARSTEESLLPPRPVAAQSARNMTTGSANDILPCFANDTRAGNDKSLLPHRHDAAQSPINKTTTATNDVPRLHDDLVGKDVILYAVLRSDLPVTKGTVISTNPNAIVGGQPLGNEYCEVVVDVVMKKDAMLPRTYGEIQTMASARNMNIAWPFNKSKEMQEEGMQEGF